MTGWGSWAFIKTILFLSLICVAYFKKWHLSMREIYKQYSWFKTDGIHITPSLKPSHGFMGEYVCISLEFDLACCWELVPCCTFFRALTRPMFGNQDEKHFAKFKFLLWNRRPCSLVEFDLADYRGLSSVHQCRLQEQLPIEGCGE